MRALELQPNKDSELIVYAKNQAEYTPLPVLRLKNDPYGRILICWRFGLWERLKLLFTGRLYHGVLTFNKPLQPISLNFNVPEEFR